MGAFETKRILNGNPASIPSIASAIETSFKNEGYEVAVQTSPTGAYDISISKGGVFALVLGMKTALKIVLKPLSNSISFEAGVGIFGMQVIPTVIMLFFAWPVIIPQIWGMVQQSKLDDKALAIAEGVLASSPQSFTAGRYCKVCGSPYEEGDKFCGRCGNKLE